MPRRPTPLAILLLLFAVLALAACGEEDGQPKQDLDLADATTEDTSDSQDTAPGDVPDTTGDDADDTLDPDTAQDVRDTFLDIPFDIDYDLAPDTADDTVDPDTATPDTIEPDTSVPDTVADTTQDTTEDTVEDTVEDTTEPLTPFDDLEDLRESELRSALRDRIDDHTGLGYDAARQAIFSNIDGIDLDSSGRLTCVYTGVTVVANGSNTVGGFNTEHSWPQSQGASSEPAKSDLHHLFPTLGTANNARGSYPFGDTDCNQSSACGWHQGGSERGPSTYNGTTVFEVRPEHRGDIARAQFYFAVRYNLPISAVSEGALRAWHQQDPPDDRERARNDAIEALQHNRNPFIDRPDFVEFISDF